MINLDSKEEIKKIDKFDIYNSINKLGSQVKQAWEEVNNLIVPENCIIAKNVVIAGMGGSALGGRIIDSLVPQRARTPIEVFTEFHIPSYVSRDTLVILSSYSGNTQETLSDLNEALSKNAQVFCITTGGKLADIMKEKNLPGYKFNPVYNPSGEPRLALGYSISAISALLSKCNFIHITIDEIEDAVKVINNLTSDYSINKDTRENLAKVFAKKLYNHIPVLVASEHLVGVTQAFKNQLNENAKTFATIFDIPELNHHLMEGLKNPKKVREYLKFLFFESDLYSQDVKKRYPITYDVIAQNEVMYETVKLQSQTKLNQIFETLTFSSFVSYYLAILYEQDPKPIPWVDYFKSKLSRI